jgi:putative ABC transport system permease protein
MESLFGIPMNSIMIAMIVLLAISVATVGVTALRNRIMFLVGLRNIPRRLAQTVLIIIGLMLSTLIISAAFTTGDTVDNSITKMMYDALGHVDEIIEYKTEHEDEGVGQSDVTIPESAYVELRDALAGDPSIDGIAPVLVESVPAVNEEEHLSAPGVHVMGIDPATMTGFPDIINLQGEVLDPNSLRDNEVYVNESAADELDVRPGDTVTIYFQNQPFRFTVADVVRDKVATGAIEMGTGEGMVGRLSALQEIFGRRGVFDFIAISNRGGVRDSVSLSDSVIDKIEQVIDDKKLNLSVAESKQEDLEIAEMAGNSMMTFFLILGLFSIAAGVLLIIMIFVMLAAERKMEMGITRAIGTKRRHLIQMFMSEGMGYNMLSALVGVTLGVMVSLILTSILAAVFSEFGFSISPTVTPQSLIISYSLGIVLTFVTVVFASWRVSNLNIVRAIRDLPEPEARPGLRSLIAGVLLLLLGGLLMFAGMAGDVGFPYTLGFSLALFGLGIGLRYLHIPERPLFTSIGTVLLLFWLFGAGGRLPKWMTANRELSEGGIEMFFLSGIVMVAAATFVLVYNADLLLRLFTLAASRAGRILPAVKTAVAYPMASKFRTGMTIAMISLVIFALTTMSTMNFNFERLFLSEKARGGWDVEVFENPNNPIGDLQQTLAGSEVDTTQFTSLGALEVANPAVAELRQDGQEEFAFYLVKGADVDFLADPGLAFTARATGYKDDESVWEALRTNPKLAIIDANALPQEFAFGGMDLFHLDGVNASTSEFEPIRVTVRDSATASEDEVQIIGILDYAASGSGPFSNFSGLITSPKLIQGVFGGPEYSMYFIRLADPNQAETVAKGIESTLFTTGAQADSIKAQREDETAMFQNFLYLMQGFMGLGLVVGVAAVGVIAFRTVVERRQQIGMLRAIGYQRSTVALSFLMESSFVTLLGILSGVGLALMLSYFLVTGGELGGGEIEGFYVPWLQIILISAFAYFASLLMTFVPARQASSIPIAEALRYE